MPPMKSNADEYYGAYYHAAFKVKYIRHNGVQNAAARNVLQRNNNQLNDNLAEYAQHNGFHVVVAFNKFRNGSNVLFAVFFCHKHTHYNGAKRPGNSVPPGGKANAEGMFRNADG